MASCHDCVHVEVCEDFTKAKLSPKRAEELLPVLREHGRTCEHFKARSRFVELPFKSRSHYYRILSEIDGYVIAIIFQSINAYHDREEAEKALKERDILKEKGE